MIPPINWEYRVGKSRFSRIHTLLQHHAFPHQTRDWLIWTTNTIHSPTPTIMAQKYKAIGEELWKTKVDKIVSDAVRWCLMSSGLECGVICPHLRVSGHSAYSRLWRRRWSQQTTGQNVWGKLMASHLSKGLQHWCSHHWRFSRSLQSPKMFGFSWHGWGNLQSSSILSPLNVAIRWDSKCFLISHLACRIGARTAKNFHWSLMKTHWLNLWNFPPLTFKSRHRILMLSRFGTQMFCVECCGERWKWCVRVRGIDLSLVDSNASWMQIHIWYFTWRWCNGNEGEIGSLLGRGNTSRWRLVPLLPLLYKIFSPLPYYHSDTESNY